VNEFHEVDILYAEDSAADAEMTLRALKKANLGNNVVWVKDGQEALDVLSSGWSTPGKHRVARLVLLDLNMPKVDGLEVLRTIRATARLRTLPVVMLTSSTEEADILKSYELGVNGYIVKPVDFQRLSDELSRLGFYWMAMNRLASPQR
jgi:two-component system response regulator